MKYLITHISITIQLKNDCFYKKLACLKKSDFNPKSSLSHSALLCNLKGTSIADAILSVLWNVQYGTSIGGTFCPSGLLCLVAISYFELMQQHFLQFLSSSSSSSLGKPAGSVWQSLPVQFLARSWCSEYPGCFLLFQRFERKLS